MRHFLEELKFKIFEHSYTVKLLFGKLSDGTKYITLSFFLVLWIAYCAFVFSSSYGYENKVLSGDEYKRVDIATQTLRDAQELREEEEYAKAFDLLATHYNNFSSKYSVSNLERVKYLLKNLSSYAQTTDIDTLYDTKDLSVQQPIYKFVGYVTFIDTDPMYGVTYTVSNSETRTHKQLEVTGLSDVSLGSQVEFFGVPKFDTVTSPIKVEAYVVPNE